MLIQLVGGPRDGEKFHTNWYRQLIYIHAKIESHVSPLLNSDDWTDSKTRYTIGVYQRITGQEKPVLFVWRGWGKYD